MLRKILIPLDGSELSDRILSKTRSLFGEQDDLEYVLMRVIQPFAHPVAERDERAARVDSSPDANELRLRRQSAKRHLARLSEELVASGVKVKSLAPLGQPAAIILKKIEQLKPCLVAMATHGRSGTSRWIRGSVAERVLRACSAPLLLWNPTTERDAKPKKFERILVPLDGSEWAASILTPLVAFAAHDNAEVILLRVDSHPPTQTPAEGDGAVPDGPLEPFRERLSNAGIKVRTLVVRGQPADVILNTLESENIDLCAMSTHGRSGLSRWVFGSVAEKVLRNCHRPLLIQRVVGEPSAQDHEAELAALQEAEDSDA